MKIGQSNCYWYHFLDSYFGVSPGNRLCFPLGIKLWRIGWQLANLPQTTRSSNLSPTTPPCLCHQESKFHISHFLSTFIFSPSIDLIKYFVLELKFERSLYYNSWSNTPSFQFLAIITFIGRRIPLWLLLGIT